MSEVIIYGLAPSSYVRSARITLGEKGVAHKLEEIDLTSDEHRQRHPWGKMPTMAHGDVKLYETNAICRYIDEAFDGPSLQPKDATQRAFMEQWISVANSYLYPHGIRDYVLQYIFPRGEGGQPDRKVIDAAVPAIKSDFAIIDKAYGGSDFIVGNALSLADIFIMPIVASVGSFPEGAAILEDCSNLKRAFKAIEGREAYKAAQPPAPPQ